MVDHTNNDFSQFLSRGPALLDSKSADCREGVDPLHFDTVWVVGLQNVEDGEYVYAVTNLDLKQGGRCADLSCSRQGGL